MSVSNAFVKARVEADLKSQSEDVLRDVGLDMAGAIRMFLKQVVMQGGIPFAVKVPQPNARTVRAIEASFSGEGVETFDSVEALFADAQD